MRWTLLLPEARADALAADDRSVFFVDHDNAMLGRFDTSSGALTTGAGWGAATAIVVHAGQAVIVGDDVGRVWATDPDCLGAADAGLIAKRVGPVRAMATDEGGLALYALVGNAPPQPLHAGRLVSLPSVPAFPGSPLEAPARPEPLRGSRLVRLDPHGGEPVTIARLPRATGVAVHPDGSSVFLPTAAGTLLAVDTASGATTVAADGLVAPGACAWMSPGSLLAVAEPDEDRIVLVDLTTGEIRRIGAAPHGITGLGVCKATVVVGTGSGFWGLPVVEADLRRVHIHDPAGPVYRGGYARVGVDVGLSGIAEADLELGVVGGPEFGLFSGSIEHPPNPGTAVLVAGPHAGRYTIEARAAGAGPVVATAEFEIVDYWPYPDGPSQAFTGKCELFSGGASGWGSLWNGIWPWSFTFGAKPISGTRSVAIIFADLPNNLTTPTATKSDYEDAFNKGVPYKSTTASVAAYYAEMSGKKLVLTLAGGAPITVMLKRPWRDYFDGVKHPKTGDDIFKFKYELVADAVWEAGSQVDLGTVDTVVVVVPSPNGGKPTPLPLPPYGSVSNFAWPFAGGSTFMWPAPLTWRWKSFRCVVMPAEFNALQPPNTVLTTLSHEIGHTLGMGDLYRTPVRNVVSWDLMSKETTYPALSLPHRVALGWTPRSQLKTYNFLATGSADETITITAAELAATAPPPGEFSGIEIEIQDGRRYYFEYRSTQGSDAPMQQVSDQQLAPDQRVVGYDVMAGSYTPPIDRGPIIMLNADDDDLVGGGVPGVFGVGADYEEFDPGGNSIFRLEVMSTDDNSADVHVKYGPPVISGGHLLSGPDPSIRPWPGNGIWVSPDVTISNGITALFGFPAIQNGATNTVEATVANNTDQPALGVTVGFWVKDFTISESAPEQFLGFSARQDVPANSWKKFSVDWAVPNNRPYGVTGLPYPTHVCLVARITPLVAMVGSDSVLLERSVDNNVAQTNITLAFSSFASPATRTRVPVSVSNPYDDRAVTAHIHVDQDRDGWRTYIGRTRVLLGPTETRTVELMMECLYDQPGYPDLPEELRTTPLITAAVSYVYDGGDAPDVIGGGTIEIRPGRAVTIEGIDVSRTSSIGRVLDLASGAPLADGSVLVSARAADGTEVSAGGLLAPNGTFNVATPDVSGLPGPVDIDILFWNKQNATCEVRLSVP